jgi:hypothetical protein
MSDKRDDYLRGISASAPVRRLSVHDADRAQIYRAVFKAVANPQDWRAPIHCLVSQSDPFKTLYTEAIMFATGTHAEFFLTNEREPNGDYLLRMVAEGYRLGPCGDH